MANEQVPSKDLLHRLRTGALCEQEGCRCHAIDARSGCQCAEAADEIESLRHKNDRWNVETTEDGFRICRGHHERAAGCEWEYFVPRSAHEPPADDLYLMLVRRGYPQHEADEIARMTARIESGRPAQPPVATPAAESGLIRYDIRPGFPDEIEFNFDPNGEWVRFDDVWPELQQLRARASQPPIPGPGMHPNCTDPCPICDREDAERWRALIGCRRVRVLGSAGIRTPSTTGYAHIGVEFWTHHETPTDPAAIKDLTTFTERATATKREG